MLMMLNACEPDWRPRHLDDVDRAVVLGGELSISGATILHGPHHAAQKSTITGRSA
jgi:hypothetical protein